MGEPSGIAGISTFVPLLYMSTSTVIVRRFKFCTELGYVWIGLVWWIIGNCCICYLFYHFPFLEDKTPETCTRVHYWVRCDMPLCHLTTVSPTAHCPFKTNLDKVVDGKKFWKYSLQGKSWVGIQHRSDLQLHSSREYPANLCMIKSCRLIIHGILDIYCRIYHLHLYLGPLSGLQRPWKIEWYLED